MEVANLLRTCCGVMDFGFNSGLSYCLLLVVVVVVVVIIIVIIIIVINNIQYSMELTGCK